MPFTRPISTLKQSIERMGASVRGHQPGVNGDTRLPIRGYLVGPTCLTAWSLTTLLLCAAVWLGFAAWRHLSPVVSASGWSYSTYRGALPRVSAIALDAAGRLFASEELPDRQGKIIEIKADGLLVDTLSGLSKPDGLAAFLGGVAISQEGGELPVLWWRDEQRSTLFSADRVEGMASDNQYLYAVEDLKDSGRLLRYNSRNQELSVLREGLDEAEGIAVCPDGRLFYLEKRFARISLLQADGLDRVVLEGLNEPGFLMCNDDGLWITEDATHMARLLLLDPQQHLWTILSHLRAPQSIIAIAPGHYLLAEQGRNRIIELQRQPDIS